MWLSSAFIPSVCLEHARFEVHHSSTSHDITYTLDEGLMSWVRLHIVIAVLDILEEDDESMSETALGLVRLGV